MKQEDDDVVTMMNGPADEVVTIVPHRHGPGNEMVTPLLRNTDVMTRMEP